MFAAFVENFTFLTIIEWPRKNKLLVFLLYWANSKFEKYAVSYKGIQNARDLGDSNDPIDLIGADAASKLMTGRLKSLKSS